MPRLAHRRRLTGRRAPPLRARVAIALTDDALDRIHQVAAACRAAGFTHDSTLRDVGVLTGSAGIVDLPKLRAVPGVLVIETARGPLARRRRLPA